jgi:hypothetical protein
MAIIQITWSSHHLKTVMRLEQTVGLGLVDDDNDVISNLFDFIFSIRQT